MNVVPSISRGLSGALIVTCSLALPPSVPARDGVETESASSNKAEQEAPAAPEKKKKKKKKFATRIHPLEHARADEVAALLHGLLGSGRPVASRGSTRGGFRTSSGRGVVSRSRPGSHPPVLQAMARADAGVTIIPYLPTNCLLIQASEPDLDRILEILAEVDTPRRQVFLQAAIVKIDSDSELHRQIEVLASRKATRTRDDSGREPDVLARILTSDDFPALLQYFRMQKTASILASPFLLARNNEQNRIDIVETQYVTHTTVQNNQTVLSSQQGEPAGISLGLRPTISASRQTIVLDLDLSISAFTPLDSGAGTLPPKTETSIRSSLTVPDGHIHILGGLGRQSQQDGRPHRRNLYVFLRASVQDPGPEK